MLNTDVEDGSRGNKAVKNNDVIKEDLGTCVLVIFFSFFDEGGRARENRLKIHITLLP